MGLAADQPGQAAHQRALFAAEGEQLVTLQQSSLAAALMLKAGQRRVAVDIQHQAVALIRAEEGMALARRDDRHATVLHASTARAVLKLQTALQAEHQLRLQLVAVRRAGVRVVVNVESCRGHAAIVSAGRRFFSGLQACLWLML